jgi:uncharacterized protein (DUF2225 family)
MTSELPFYTTKVECPICKTINEFEHIKVGAYTESDRDTDFCPTGITWRNQRYQAYNPLVYFTATCANCYYTREFTKEYKEWKSDSYFKTYRQKTVKEQHLSLLSEADSVIRQIGEKLDINRYPTETAILKLILAVIDEIILDKGDTLDLGRFYIRIAWLFRDMEKGESPNQQTLKSHLIETDNKIEKLVASIKLIKANMRKVGEAVNQQFEDNKIASEMKSILYPVKGKYDAELSSMQELLETLDAKTGNLRDIAKEHMKIALGSSGDEGVAGFHEYRSFYEFLAIIGQNQTGIPVSEREALEMAVEHYKSAFHDGKSIGGGNQQIQASYLIAELSRRIENYQQAKEFFNTTIRSGQELIYRNKGDRSKTALARKILELAIEQARTNMAEINTA